jgi:16S rRNA (guanine966-N2)-methyltransferase
VLDLFAGTGVLGFEALSRGASHATFVEQDRAAARLLLRHGDLLRANAAVQRAEALDWLGRQDTEPAWDVVFLDPPFGSGLQEATLDRLAGRLAEGGTVYVEAEAGFDHARVAARCGLRAARVARAGNVAYGLLRAARG